MYLSLNAVFLVALVVVIAALFWRAHGLREFALRATRRHCRAEEIQLLDQSVGLHRLTLQRDSQGKRRLTRIYQFEFTVTGGERYTGHTVMQAGRIKRVTLPPHRYTPSSEEVH